MEKPSEDSFKGSDLSEAIRGNALDLIWGVCLVAGLAVLSGALLGGCWVTQHYAFENRKLDAVAPVTTGGK